MTADDDDIEELIRALNAYAVPPSELMKEFYRKSRLEHESGEYPYLQHTVQQTK